MERNLVKKMIRNCFIQYQHDVESVPLREEEYEKMAEEVSRAVAADPNLKVFDVVNDVVYEYLSKW
ncbi:YqzH family protein [Sutcliffiella horikoshii]|uniref:YqzH family protein n=1 Tax=Sutcliffiella horikoshii TaxID=79883 RepID=UPI001CFC9E17|nr:YqzH family protein [Sutcliffiella horikoshii]